MAKKTTGTKLVLSDLQRAILQLADSDKGTVASALVRQQPGLGHPVRLTVLQHMLDELVAWNYLTTFRKTVYGERSHLQTRYRLTILGFEAVANKGLAIEL